MRDHVRPVSVTCAVLTVCATALLSTGAANSTPFNSNSIEPPGPVQDALRPRQIAAKPGKTRIDRQTQYTDMITVKFADDCAVRLRNGALTDFATDELVPAATVLQRVQGGTWTPMHTIGEARLDAMRQTAQRNLGRVIADLNTFYFLRLPAGMDAATVCDDFNKLAIVEMAKPAPRPAPAPGSFSAELISHMVPTASMPAPPDFEPQQGYLNAAPGGIDAQCMWNLPGGDGSNVGVCDVEYSWNFNHNDLPGMTSLVANPVDPFADNNHGTAVMGEVGGLNNGVGVTGACYASTLYVAAANTTGGYNPAGAITAACGTLTAGDVILLEQQTGGQGGNFVPLEWLLSVYTATQVAVGNGISVVAAAGNGSENLDDAFYNSGHAPFLAANDSGAIIVGAGGSPGSGSDLSTLGFSSFGSTVDLQGWGHNVLTCGYGDFYSAEGTNWWYTSTFNGTSSASPIVTAAVACLQSANFAQTGSYLSPAAVKAALQATGTPQAGGGNIGPRPNTSAAFASLFPALDVDNDLIPDACEPDCNNNNVPDDHDIAIGTSQDCNNNGIPDECDISNGAPDCNNNGVPDSCDISSGTSLDCNANGIPDECNDAPVNGTCATAQAMAINSQTNGSNVNACIAAAPVCGSLLTQHTGVWYSVVGNGSKLAASTCAGATFDTQIAVYTGTCNALTCVGANDDACGNSSNVEFCTMPGQTYYIFVNGFLSAQGNFTLDVTDVGSGFDCNCNGIADECDLEFNPSLDINNDGFIDSCVLCAGDTNCDGIINYLDMITVWSNMGTGGPAGDVNFDGTVNFLDYIVVAWNYGKVCM